jgi:hypothetical protein
MYAWYIETMAGRLHGVTLPPQKSLFWRLSAIATLALIASACGMMDYEIGTRQNNFNGTNDKKTLGAIHFHFGDTLEPTHVTVRRIRGGYALQSSLYESSDGTQIDFVTSHSNRLKGFVGVQGKVSF